MPPVFLFQPATVLSSRRAFATEKPSEEGDGGLVGSGGNSCTIGTGGAALVLKDKGRPVVQAGHRP